jgi:hypothetical protein
MIADSKSFHRSTPLQRNDGTLHDAERPVERKSLKTIASAVLQRNAVRNDSGTDGNSNAESFHKNKSFRRSTVWEWNDGTVWGAYTPYCLPMPEAVWLSMIKELDGLIQDYCTFARVSDDAAAKIRSASAKQSLASIPGALDWFRREIAALKQAQGP